MANQLTSDGLTLGSTCVASIVSPWASDGSQHNIIVFEQDNYTYCNDIPVHRQINAPEIVVTSWWNDTVSSSYQSAVVTLPSISVTDGLVLAEIPLTGTTYPSSSSYDMKFLIKCPSSGMYRVYGVSGGYIGVSSYNPSKYTTLYPHLKNDGSYYGRLSTRCYMYINEYYTKSGGVLYSSLPFGATCISHYATDESISAIRSGGGTALLLTVKGDAVYKCFYFAVCYARIS